jgi:hypothetical protein
MESGNAERPAVRCIAWVGRSCLINSMPNMGWRSRSTIFRWHCANLWMLPANSAFRDARAAWFTIPKCKMVFRCAAILGSADDYGEQSVVLYEVSSLETAHSVSSGLTRSRSKNPAFKGGIFPSITVALQGKGFQTGEHLQNIAAAATGDKRDDNAPRAQEAELPRQGAPFPSATWERGRTAEGGNRSEATGG